MARIAQGADLFLHGNGLRVALQPQVDPTYGVALGRNIVIDIPLTGGSIRLRGLFGPEGQLPLGQGKAAHAVQVGGFVDQGISLEEGDVGQRAAVVFHQSGIGGEYHIAFLIIAQEADIRFSPRGLLRAVGVGHMNLRNIHPLRRDGIVKDGFCLDFLQCYQGEIDALILIAVLAENAAVVFQHKQRYIEFIHAFDADGFPGGSIPPVQFQTANLAVGLEFQVLFSGIEQHAQGISGVELLLTAVIKGDADTVGLRSPLGHPDEAGGFRLLLRWFRRRGHMCCVVFLLGHGTENLAIPSGRGVRKGVFRILLQRLLLEHIAFRIQKGIAHLIPVEISVVPVGTVNLVRQLRGGAAQVHGGVAHRDIIGNADAVVLQLFPVNILQCALVQAHLGHGEDSRTAADGAKQ